MGRFFLCLWKFHFKNDVSATHMSNRWVSGLNGWSNLEKTSKISSVRSTSFIFQRKPFVHFIFISEIIKSYLLSYNKYMPRVKYTIAREYKRHQEFLWQIFAKQTIKLQICKKFRIGKILHLINKNSQCKNILSFSTRR